MTRLTDTVQAIKNISPDDMVSRGVIERANDGKTIVCPDCGNGTHKRDSKGIEPSYYQSHWSYHCFSCDAKFDNIALLGLYYSLDHKNDKEFIQILKQACEDFGIPFDGDDPYRNFERVDNPTKASNASTSTATSAKNPDPAEIERAEKNEAKKLELIRRDISEAQEHLNDLPVDARRGLSVQTLRHFGCGFLERWTSPTRIVEGKKLYYSRRLIIPTSPNHYLASAVDRDPDYSKSWKLHEGGKEIFNSTALTAEGVVVIVEGEIDAMSVWQATNGEVPVIAIGGAAGKEWIDSLPEKAQFLIMFDNDSAGKKDSKPLREELIQRGYPAAVAFLSSGETKLDANDILRTDGADVLADKVKSILDATKIELEKAAAEIAARKALKIKIDEWTADNGEIDSAVITRLKSDVEYLQSLTTDKITAAVAAETKTLRAVANCRYYVYRDIAESFMARVDEVRAEAQAKVKKSSAENPVDSAVRELAAIPARNKLEDSIAKFTTEINKAHRQYQDKLKAEKENAERRARRERYEADKPTTQKFCADCPINLILPYGTYFSAKGISVVDDSGLRPKKYKAADTPVVPTKIFREPSTGIVRYEVAIKAMERQDLWRRVVVDAKTLYDSRAVLDLTNHGAAISSTSAKHLTEYFSQMISLNAPNLPECKMYTQPGWTNDNCEEFVYPNTDNENYIVRGNGFDYESAYTSRGKLEDWLAMCKRVIDSSTVARLTLGAALASPLIRVLGLSPMQLNLACPSGNGKTAILKFGASIYGKPLELLQKCNGTANALEMIAVANGDFPTLIDEIQTMSRSAREQLDNLIYNRESGKTRARLRRDSTLMERQKFSGVTITTGEQTLTNEFSGEGAVKRCLDVTDANIFDNDFAVEVHQFCRGNYGLVGRDYVKFVMDNKEEIPTLFEHMEQNIRRLFPAKFPSHVTFVALCYTALATFINSFGITTVIDLDGDIQRIFGDLRDKKSSTNSERAIATVSEFVMSNAAYFRDLGIDEKVVPFDPAEPKPAACYGYRYCNGDVAIFPKILRKALEDFPDANACIRGFSNAGYLVEGGTSAHKYQKSIRVDEGTHWLYYFRHDVLFGEGEESETD